MKKLVLTVAVAVGALFSLPVQAAPLASGASGLQAQVRPEAQQVYHCRAWSDGWNCGWGNLRQEHSRYWSHRRSGSEGSGGGGYSGGKAEAGAMRGSATCALGAIAAPARLTMKANTTGT